MFSDPFFRAIGVCLQLLVTTQLFVNISFTRSAHNHRVKHLIYATCTDTSQLQKQVNMSDVTLYSKQTCHFGDIGVVHSQLSSRVDKSMTTYTFIPCVIFYFPSAETR